MQFDYSRLRGKIREVFGTEAAFAKALEMGRVSLSQRLNNSLEFSATEIRKSCSLLGIDSAEIPEYFFAEKVQKHELQPRNAPGEKSNANHYERRMPMPRMRTAAKAHELILQEDPDTEITLSYIRRLIATEAVPVIHVGRKKLVDVDQLIAYLAAGNKPSTTEPTPGYGHLRRVEI